MRFIQTLINSTIILILLLIIGALLGMLGPAIGKSLHDNEIKRKTETEAIHIKESLRE